MDSHIVQPAGLVESGQAQGQGANPVPKHTAPEHRLLGNYRILRLLGQGGFADVYLGEHIHLRTQAAIKVLQVRLVESNIQSFLNEARTIAHLVHPYIIRVLDFGVEADMPFLVMDYAPRGTFRQRFLQGKPLPPTPLFPAIKQAASALQYAHDKKLIHRDVKPENMLLGPNDEVLLSDFGFALIQTSLSRPSPETAGTASYMAPEQFQGKPQPASDQYSLGVIAYEWLTGTCPFQGTFMELASQHMLAQPPSLLERVPGLSTQVAQVVMRALAKEPDQRFPTVGDFARALERACLTSNPNFAASSSISPPPFLAGASSAPTAINSGSSLSQNKSTMSPHLSERNPPSISASFGAFQRMQTPPYASSSGLPPLQPEHLAQDLSEVTNVRMLSPLKSLEQPFSPAAYRSQSQVPALSELPPLPQQPFLAPELAKPNRPASLVSQTFPAQQNASIRVRSQSRNFPVLHTNSSAQPTATVFNERQSPFSTSGQMSVPPSTPSARTEDAWKRSKPTTTSRTLYFFVIFMVALIIASTAILIMLTDNLTGISTNQRQSTPHTNATVPTTSQHTTQTPETTTTNRTEQNPYGNHNGTLVLNDPLNQQNQQTQWDELSGRCSFSARSYHVVAGPPSQGFTLCNATASDYANFVYQVQMTFTKVTSTVGSGGLVFRGNKANTQFYFLEIFTTGNYAFYRCPGAKGACATLSASTKPIPSFRIDLNKPNTIALMASDSTFYIYVNNQLVVGPIVDAAPDATYSHGKIGMMARQNNTNAVTDVSFNESKIWKL
jgi:serine/threonine protein kinase